MISEIALENKVLKKEVLKKEPRKPLLLDHAEQLFRLLHLMMEDLKLQKLREGEVRKLRKMLMATALHLIRVNLTSYLAYYTSEDPSLAIVFANEIKSRPCSSSHTESVPNLTHWLQGMLSGRPESKFPLVFNNTRIVCRLYEVLTQQS
jgi:hypothetical protein